MKKIDSDKKYILSRILLTALAAFGFLAFFSALWYFQVYGDIGFDALFYTLFTDFSGVQSGLVVSWLLRGLLPTVVCSALVFVLLFVIFYKKGKEKGEKDFFKMRMVSLALVIALFLFCFGDAATRSGLSAWLLNTAVKSDIYETEYVDPKNAEITFPEEKRNLIYIFMESMETTFMPEDKGGANKDNCLPNLYNLAKDNVNFSHNSSVGGGRDIYGATWTAAAMAAHTAGVTLRFPLSVEGNLNNDILPGVKNISQIFDENGYNQAFLVGSNSHYGGRYEFFNKRGVDNIYDIYTAYEDGIVPEGYWQWWGMEDKYLFEYSKKVLTEMAAEDKPFVFTTLTVDTHHVAGFKCTECGDEFEEQYSNVLNCSDKQVYEFVKWIQAQDFYENTTIIITGDHGTMDYGYIKRNTDTDQTRRIYNCIINPAVEAKNSKNREFITLDMFPTTLGALGCEIKGNRLGLGTNLFSDEKTLVEKYGYDKLEEKLSQTSEYYNTKFD